MRKFFLILVLLGIYTTSCTQEVLIHNVDFFKDTEAYDLALAIRKNDTVKIEELVKEKPKLLNITNKTSGSNVLALALIIENYDSFKKLLELGADPSFINPLTKRSILIDACKFYEKPKPYTIDIRYMKLLLEKGANPNYAVEKDFEDEKGHYQRATSPIHEASRLDLEMVKLLIKYGADPYKKLEQHKTPPFYYALSGFKNWVKISNFYIDSINVDIKDPLIISLRQPTNKDVKFYIQDVVFQSVNSYVKAIIRGNLKEMEELKKEFPNIEHSKNTIEQLEFIKKLEGMGVDFKNYEYKK